MVQVCVLVHSLCESQHETEYSLFCLDKRINIYVALVMHLLLAIISSTFVITIFN